MRRKMFTCLSMILVVFTNHVTTGSFLDQEGGNLLLDQNRSDEVSDPFEIQNAWIEEKEGKKWIHIEIIQSKGCDGNYSDLFEMSWNGIILMIYPPELGLTLKLNTSKCAELKEKVSGILILDLHGLIGDEKLLQTAVFKVFNTSKKAGENEYVVSS